MPEPSLRMQVNGVPRVFCCHKATLSGRFAPNSIEAVEECITAGVPRVEVDVRFLADDAMLIFHDSTLDTESTGRGSVDSLTAAEARLIRHRTHPESALCFLEDVVERLAGSGTFLQVDLKLPGVISPPRAHRLAKAVAPLGARVFVGSEAHWNLRPLAALGVPVALDPTPQWHASPKRIAGDGRSPGRMGLHGLWDDAPIAHIPGVSNADYTASRILDLLALLPEAVEWMVDIGTLRHLASIGCDLGIELAAHGVALAAWTMRDERPERSKETLSALFRLGATTVITDHPLAIVAYASALG